MLKISVKRLYEDYDPLLDTQVKVCGWIRMFRISGGKGKQTVFVRLYDGSYIDTIQIIFSVNSLSSEKKDYFDDIISRGKVGMSIEVVGKLVKSPATEQPIEIQAHEYIIRGDVMDPEAFPIQKSYPSQEYLRTVPHLRSRVDYVMALGRIKSALRMAMSLYFASIDFPEVQIPLITDNECESGANPFTVTTLIQSDQIDAIKTGTDGKSSIDYSRDFFKKHSFLTVSGQLHLEAIVLGGMSQAWCMTTAFRAEPSTGPRHLAEFWMAELEFCFSELEDNMRVNEDCIKFCFVYILRHCKRDLEFFEKGKPGLIATLKKYATTPFIISSHEECVRLMLEDIKTGKVKIDPSKTPDGDLYMFREAPGYEDDLSKDHERYITEALYGGMPVFVRFFPAKIKSFYMPKIDKGRAIEHIDGFDLLFPEIGEIVGGSQRETDYHTLIERMKEMGVKPESLEFYSDLRKYGSVSHGGSGIGFDRLMMVCTGIFSAKEMIPFPRAYGLSYF
jgi:asparaginyl-tRNA synthetase